eukprot:3480736-Rhodomonas_salina.3
MPATLCTMIASPETHRGISFCQAAGVARSQLICVVLNGLGWSPAESACPVLPSAPALETPAPLCRRCRSMLERATARPSFSPTLRTVVCAF